MARKVKDLTPPKGCSRVFFRMPVWLYRAKMGWLLGDRFLLLNHIGRKTGLPRQAVLEVVQHDEETDVYIVAVGFGEKSAWYRNLLANPEVSIQVGRRKLAVNAVQLSPEEAGQVMVDFARRYPNEAKFANMLGYEVDGTEEDYRHMGEMMTLMAFHPQ